MPYKKSGFLNCLHKLQGHEIISLEVIIILEKLMQKIEKQQIIYLARISYYFKGFRRIPHISKNFRFQMILKIFKHIKEFKLIPRNFHGFQGF